MHVSDLEVKVTDFEILCFWLKFLKVYSIPSETWLDLVDTLSDIRH